jgi:hypothetical protein
LQLVSDDSFFNKVIDFDGESFKEGFSSFSSSQDQCSEVFKSKFKSKLKTTENNPFELIFDIDNQVEVIMHNSIN